MATKVHKWKDVRARSKMSPAQQREVDEWVKGEVLEMDLRAVRELAGKTQVDVAAESGIRQSDVSRMERAEPGEVERRISTVRRYVEALGGRLEIFAVFDDKQVRLRGI